MQGGCECSPLLLDRLHLVVDPCDDFVLDVWRRDRNGEAGKSLLTKVADVDPASGLAELTSEPGSTVWGVLRGWGAGVVG